MRKSVCTPLRVRPEDVPFVLKALPELGGRVVSKSVVLLITTPPRLRGRKLAETVGQHLPEGTPHLCRRR